MSTKNHRSPWAALALAAALGVACNENPAPQASPEEHHDAATPDQVVLTALAIETNALRVERAVKRELRPTFRVPAQVAFNKDRMAHVGCPVKGRVAELCAKLGDDVLKGAALLVIESPELGEAQSEYIQRRSAAQTAVPQVELAKNAYERAKGLYEQTQGIALTEVQKRETEYRSSQAVLQAAKTAEQAAGNRLQLFGMSQDALTRLGESGVVDPHFTIRAPIDGQVIEREVTLGELVSPERDALLVLADVTRPWVLADVPETKLRDVAVGARARVLLGVEETHWCEGLVAFIAPALDASTRSVRIRIDVADRHPDLRPGVFAQAELTAAGTAEAGSGLVVTIPEAALQTVDGETVVFVPVAGANGTFAKRVVRVGAAAGGVVPVLSGLDEGEGFVATGTFVLKAELTKGSAGDEH